MNAIRLIYCLVSMLFLATAAGAATPIPSPPDVGARGFILQDFDSGRVLAEKNSDELLEPASLTKIMTSYVAFREIAAGNIKIDEEVTVSEKAWRTEGSRMFIEVGTTVTIDELLHGIIVQSGNDASVALAEHIAGTEETFAQMMNNQAQRLGMSASNFRNATGLPDENHYTTARDMATLTRAMISEFPVLYEMYAIKEYTFNEIKQHNRNSLLWRDKSVDGVKTGHTDAAGYCLVASAKREEMRLVSVVMGTESTGARAKASQALLNYGFRFFETHHLYQAGEPLGETRVWKGNTEQVPVGLSDPLTVTITRHQYKNLKASMNYNAQIVAPVTQGQVVGNVTLSLEGETVAEAPLVALQTIEEGSIWQRVKDEALLWWD